MSTESSRSGRQSGSGIGRPRLLQRVHEAIRVRHYSRRTEEAYAHWIKRYIFFNGTRHPETMGEAEVTAFLNHLAAERHVAAAMQNQALSAILFLRGADAPLSFLGEEPKEAEKREPGGGSAARR